jgi:hypothetical protein
MWTVAAGIRRAILLVAVVVFSGWALSSDFAGTSPHHHGRPEAGHHQSGETHGALDQAPAIEVASSAAGAVRPASQVRLVDAAPVAFNGTAQSNHSSVALPFVLSRPFDPDHHHTFSLLI